MKFLTVIEPGYLKFDFDSYYESLVRIKDKLEKDFINEYVKNEFFHDYYVKNIEMSAFEKGKCSFVLTLSENYRDTSKRVVLMYSNVKSVEYLEEVGYQDEYLYGEISSCGKCLKHEILLGDGKLTIVFDKVKILRESK